MKKIFITGTDTEVGKTYVSVALLNAFNEAGFETFGIKPIASGCEKNATGKLENSDALALQAASSIKRPYDRVNPIAFEPPIAPHIAAKQIQFNLSKDKVIEHLSNSIQPQADINLIEGVGGWHVPLNDNELVSDIVCELNLPVILVVGIKLGCINHTLLTYKTILQSKIPFLGWIANCIDSNTQVQQENIDTLKHWLSVPCLGVVPHGIKPKINVDGILDD